MPCAGFSVTKLTLKMGRVDARAVVQGFMLDWVAIFLLSTAAQHVRSSQMGKCSGIQILSARGTNQMELPCCLLFNRGPRI
jgi:hypothetical protein